MAQFGQRLLILSLCLLAAVINTEQRYLENDQSYEVCLKYMELGIVLDSPGVFNMVMQEFGLGMQDEEIIWLKNMFQRSDLNRDRHLSLHECASFIKQMGYGKYASVVCGSFSSDVIQVRDTCTRSLSIYCTSDSVLFCFTLPGSPSQSSCLELFEISLTMARSSQLVAVLGLFLLVALVNCDGPPPLGNEICNHYTQSGASDLDMPMIFDMVMIEFGRQIQTLNPMQVEQWVRDVDGDHDRRLNQAECSQLIQNILSTLTMP
ncbi:uncharacterized protein [Misgurnus anguillicaudatus]|uniref:uncharacterized protein n=1 Tax=Misgurnus anguillicaudatus TaxID=75329 RepID=UPI003CCFCB50